MISEQQIQQHELLKQLNIMNKELKLLRTQPANTNTTVPLQNVTNLLEAAANVLPSTSTNAFEHFYYIRGLNIF
jgi:hypothetical protein